MLFILRKPRRDRSVPQPLRVQQAVAVPFCRSLSPQERAITQWLLEHADPAAKQFTPQLESARVIGRCDCGCPTISMLISQEAPAVCSRRNLVATAIGVVDDNFVKLMLMQSNGYLSCLNIHIPDFIKRPCGLPSLESMKPYWRLHGRETDG
jgi:hypothetical protein